MVDLMLIGVAAVYMTIIRKRAAQISTHSLNDEITQLQDEIDNKQYDLDKLNRDIEEMTIQSADDFSKHVKQRKKVAQVEESEARKTKTIERQGNHIGIFGLTSTGKSTMVNSLLGKKLADIGVGETTKEITSYEGTTFTLWDTPGRNDELTYSNNEYISFIKGLTRRLILIQYTIKENLDLMHLLDSLGLHYDIIVNKFDEIDQNEQRQFQLQIEREIVLLKLKQKNNIFFLSAKYPKMLPDWLKMVNYLTEEKSSHHDDDDDGHTDSDSTSTSDSD